MTLDTPYYRPTGRSSGLPASGHGPELIDLPPENYSRSEYAGSLADIRTVNRFLGDYRAIRRSFSSLVPAVSGSPTGNL
jgi:hypothetical protein